MSTPSTATEVATTTTETAPTSIGAPAGARAGGRRRRTARWSAVAVGIVAALFVGVLATRGPASNAVAETPLAGRPAPPIEGPAVDGSTFRLADLQGRYVVVNFFATWCGPCRTEHPELVEFADRHRAAGDAEVVSVVYDDEVDDVRKFFDRFGGDWPVVDDSGSKVDYGVRGVPESFILDPTGVVLAKINGGVNADRLDDLLRQARAQIEGAPIDAPQGGGAQTDGAGGTR